MGGSRTEQAVIAVLQSSGTQQVAELYLICGSVTLEQAATEWALAHGYSIKTIHLWGTA